MKSRMLSVFLSSVLLLTVFAILQVRAQQAPPKAAPAANWKAVDDGMGAPAKISQMAHIVSICPARI